jgi:glycosidase
MNRFLFISNQDQDKLKRAAKIQFSLSGPKIIYYGTETGLSQGRSVWDISSHGDLQARRPMNWEDPDTDLLAFYRKLLQK